ncbi:hypothetical protein [Chromobacterium paludis]|uniref:hypothetical protein n=1 Tax=Chromobacterium paludis TaxID=2605945 RepID=UPI00143DB6F8|nr:hypothetical protein [Chromobacterium paludis]
MPSIALRALRAIRPFFAVSIATTPTRAEAAALARLLVSQGRRAVILSAAQGFNVSEVR